MRRRRPITFLAGGSGELADRDYRRLLVVAEVTFRTGGTTENLPLASHNAGLVDLFKRTWYPLGLGLPAESSPRP